MPALALALLIVANLMTVTPAAAQPKPQVDCSQFKGAEKEACEKMMAKRRN